LLLFVCLVQAQRVIVLDADTKAPISNVAVFNADKSKIALTGFDGYFDASVFSLGERISLKHISYELRRTSIALVKKRDPLLLGLRKRLPISYKIAERYSYKRANWVGVVP